VTAFTVRLDPDSTVPPFEQVRSQVAEAAAAGTLPAGTRLPPVRTLAAELDVAAGTVARAYRELEQAGVVQTRGRGGTVVTGGGDAARTEAARLAAEYVRSVRALGITPAEAVALVRAALG
jgi:DNA-binding transcriptional regulator YhcF (GntR family)